MNLTFSTFGAGHATLNRTRATGARMCVELDLLDEMIEELSVMISTTKNIWEEVGYEKMDYYCKKCGRHGHPESVHRVGQKVLTVQTIKMKNLNEEQKCERQTRMEKGTEGDKTRRVDAIVVEPSGTEKLTDGIERISHESQTEQQDPLQILEQSELVLAN